MKHFTHFKSSILRGLLSLFFLTAMVSSAWGEEATMAAGTNGSTAFVNEKAAIKVGTSSKGGDMTITVPAGATSLELYAAAWNGVTGLSLNITPADKVDKTSIALTADSGISGNSPFTLSGSESSYKFTIALSNITSETTLTLGSATKRFVVWGATYTVGGGNSTNVAPSFTTQPSGATYVKDATAAALTVVASGKPAPTYQWYTNTTNSNSNGTTIIGATSTSYIPSTTTIGTTYYYCIAKNSKGSATSNVAAITVNQPQQGGGDESDTKKITLDLSKNETTNAGPEILEWNVENILTVTANKKEATAATNNYYPGTSGKSYTSTRFYASSTLTFAPASGTILGTITYTATTVSYASALANSGWTNATASSNETTVTITPTDGSKPVIATIGGTTGATKIEINYTQPSRTLESIEVKTEPNKTTYWVGEQLDLTGLVLSAKYDIGSDQDITSGYTTSSLQNGDVLSNKGEVTVTFSYNGKTATQTITVKALPIVTFNSGSNGSCGTENSTVSTPNGGVILPSVTSSDRYDFIGWASSENANLADAGKAGETYTPTADITLHAVYKHYNVITWSVAMNTDTTHVYDNETLKYPTNPAVRNNKIFQGWTATKNYKNANTAPSYVSGGTIVSDATYYAVFATKSGQEPTAYNRVTNLDDLNGKKTIVIIDNKNSMVLTKGNTNPNGESQNTANLSESSNTIAVPSENKYFWNIEGNNSDGYQFSNTGAYLGMESTIGEGQVNLSSSNSLWNISISTYASNTFNIKNTQGTNLYLQYDAGWKLRKSENAASSQYYALKLYVPNSEVTYSDYTTFYTSGDMHSVTYDKNTDDDINGDLPATERYGLDETIVFSNTTLSRLGYRFVGWNINKDANEGISNFTMPNEDVVVYAIWEDIPEYTVTFVAAGISADVTENYGGEGVIPVDPKGIEGYNFVGWSNTETAEETTTGPALVTITEGKYHPTAETTLYAVYSIDKNAEVPGFILSANVDINGTIKYVGAWNSGNKRFDATDNASSATTFWYEDSKLFFMNGSTQTYVCNNGGTELSTEIEKNKASDWTRNFDNGLVSFKYSDARYLAYNNSSGYFRAYGTTYKYQFTETVSSVTRTKQVPYYTTKMAETLASSANLEGWKTFYNTDANYEVDENTNIYKASLNGDVVTLSKVSGSIVPKQTAVLLKTTATDYTMMLTKTGSDCSDDFSDNTLSYTTDDGETGYILSYRSEGLAFYWFNSLLANMVYIPRTAGAAALRFVIDDEHSTGISTICETSDIDATFNLTGQKAAENKGLLIKNGKVIMIK